MTSVTTDRRFGVNSGSAVKVPCRIATTANITLSGLQTIDGVTAVANDRVLVKNQTSSINNGIYNAATGTWTRAIDFDSTYDATNGTWVRVNEGTTYANSWFVLSATDPVTIGTSALSFSASQLLTQLATQLADSTSTSNGDKLVATKRTPTGAIATTVHDWIEGQVIQTDVDFGSVGDNITDDGPAIRKARDAVNPGGTLRFGRNKTYKIICGESSDSCTVGLLGNTGITFDLNGSTLNFYAAADNNQIGFWIYGNGAKIVNVGSIYFFANGHSISSQGCFGAPVFVGAFNNIGDTVASPHAAQFISGCSIGTEDCPITLGTDVSGRPALQIAGGVNDLYFNVIIPTSTTCSGVHGDWGNVGTGSSNGDPQRIIDNRALYDANTYYTTHPHDIRGKIKAGKLTNASAHITRWSSCYDIQVTGFAEEVGYAASFYTAGDFGIEFTRDGRAAFGSVNELEFVNRGIDLNISCLKCNAYGHFGDSLGDNIKLAIRDAAYVASRDPYYFCDVTFRGRVVGKNSAGVSNGMHAQDSRGGIKFIDVSASGFEFGGYIDYATGFTDGVTRGVLYLRCESYSNRSDGFAIRNSNMSDIKWIKCKSRKNGTNSAASSGFRDNGGKRTVIKGCEAGDSIVTDATQKYGFRVDAGCTDAIVEDNFVHSVSSVAGAFGYAMTGGGDYVALRSYVNNRCADSMAASKCYGGTELLPVSGTHDPVSGLYIRTFISGATSVPTTGTWVCGDKIYYKPTTVTAQGIECTVSGTFSAATDNTGDTDGITGIVTGMADTSDFFVGEWATCSGGFATTGPFRILAKTSSAITFDATSNAVVANITVATPDPVFKNMGALS